MAVVPSGALNTLTFQSANFFFPFLPQASTTVPSGNTYVYNITSTGFGSVNQGGNIFQNGQYNTTLRGF